MSKRTPKQPFGAYLKALRTESRLTQGALAKKIDRAPSYISKLERDRLPYTPSVQTLRRLAAALAVDELDLAFAANKLGTVFPVLIEDGAAVEFFRAVNQYARSTDDWNRLTNLVASGRWTSEND
jgi:transcriptional regulator with XRE-family HTH domain